MTEQTTLISTIITTAAGIVLLVLVVGRGAPSARCAAS